MTAEHNAAGPDPALARRRYARLASRYDVTLALLQPAFARHRRQAVAALRLKHGDTVIDVGAGTGASLALLSAAVGETGRVIAIESSREMLEVAARRARWHGWRSIEFLEADAQSASGLPPVDGVLFFLTHDILQSPEALANLFAQVPDGARVSSFGAAAGGPWVIRRLVRAFTAPFVTTFSGLECPWQGLQPFTDDLDVRRVMLGQAYQATCTVATSRRPGRDRG